ncbi:MAG: hypothetical protein QXS56_04180 [Fervidicoccaceae archaeon]
MKLFAELSFELGKEEKRLKQANSLICEEKSIFSGVDIPESPLSIPSANSIVIGSILKQQCPKAEIFSHIRLSDLNPISFISLVSAANLTGIDAVFVTSGEKDERGFKSQITTEEALSLAKNYKLEKKLGAIISMRYDEQKILERLSLGFKKFLILRMTMEEIEKLERISERGRELKIELYPYIIIKTEKNLSIIERISQPSYDASTVKNVLDKIEGLVSGVIISTAGDIKFLKNLENTLFNK